MEILFNDNSGLYFYSALLQANAAMIALLGLYTIFRIQAAYSTIESVKTFLIAEHSGIRDRALKFDSMNFKEQSEIIRKYTGDDGLSKGYRKWYSQIELIRKLKIGILFPTILLGLALILDSVFLFITPTLHTKYPEQELIWGYINLIYEIVMVIVISWKIIRLVSWKLEDLG